MPTPFDSEEILAYHIGEGHPFAVEGNIWVVEQAPDGTIITNRFVEPAEVETFETPEEPPKDLVWHSGDVITLRFQEPLPDTADIYGGAIDELYSEVKRVGHLPIGSLNIDASGILSFSPDRIDTEIIVPGFPETTLPAFQNLKGRLPIGIIENNDNRWSAMQRLVFHQPPGDLTGEATPLDWMSSSTYPMFDPERNSADDTGKLRDQLNNVWFGVKGHILRAVLFKVQTPPVQGSPDTGASTVYEGLHFCSPAEVSEGLDFPAPYVTGSWTVQLHSYEINGVPQPIGAAVYDIGPIIDSEFHGLIASVNSLMAKGVCITMDLIANEA